MGIVIGIDYIATLQNGTTTWSDDSNYITVEDSYNLTVRSSEGLKMQVDYFLHYKVGVSFDN